jgi:crotonobetainyl-CoA:carnitine CoA-transferase CaiB-like acyl-CoA transferase
VRDLKEVFDDPQLAAREMIARVEHATIGSLNLLGVPVKLSDTPGAVTTAPPTLGQHTDAVLRTSLGLTEAEITALREQGAI